MNSSPEVTPPNDPNIKIWRYMDFTKFVSMLVSQALFFPRSDKLGDSHEGSLPLNNASLRNVSFEQMYPEIGNGASNESFGISKTAFEYNRKDFHDKLEWVRQYTAISCWHMNNHESYGMWRIYTNLNEGIAIQSTYARLSDSLRENSPAPLIGVVKYIDYQVAAITPYNLIAPFFHKRRSFEYEQELRAVLMELPLPIGHWRDKHVDPDFIGRSIPVDLRNIIEGIYVAPQASKWFLELVQQIVTKYDLNLPKPIRSPLDSKALF
jgi:hypothetical protein